MDGCMGNAVWLFCAVPTWYFSTLLMPFGAGMLSAIPASGAVCLVIGAVWGIIERKANLLVFLLLIVASQALVVVAGFWRGSLRGTTNELTLQTLLGIFLLLQIAIAGYFVWRLKGARWPAAALAIFTSSYAAFGAFVAAMAFSNDWL
jgi:hypothetical protein